MRMVTSYASGQDIESETVIRPIFIALAFAFTPTTVFAETCIASHYGYSGGRTASGERMNPGAMTAAHRTKSFGSHVTVTSQRSGRSVTVRINDRGHSSKGVASTCPLEQRGRLEWLASKRYHSTDIDAAV